MENPFPSLYLTRLTFTLRIESELWLPLYKGFTFRGGLGYALLELLCDCQADKRASYLHEKDCVFQKVFKPKIYDHEKQELVLAKNVPAPLLLNPPDTTRRRFLEGEVLLCEVVLIGEFSAYWRHIIEAFHFLGQMGIGANASRFTVLCVYDHTGQAVYNAERGLMTQEPTALNSNDMLGEDSGRPLYIHFLTPTLIRLRGRGSKNKTVRPNLFNDGNDIEHIYLPIAQRLHTLSLLYCNDSSLGRFFFDQYRRDFSQIRLIKNWLRWQRWGKHFSRAQNKHLHIEGLVGEILFEGNTKNFMPYFYLGQFFNVGKHIMSGMGRYELIS